MRHLSLALAALTAAATASAQDADKPWNAMDYGPCLSTTVQGWSDDNVALKGRTIFLGDKAGVIFDTELLRVAAAWTDGRLNLRGTPFDGAHGPIPNVVGEPTIQTDQAPGFAHDGSFADPRPIPHGPLPDAHGRFLGHYVHGDRVVLSYEVGGRKVLESHDVVKLGDAGVAGIRRQLDCEAGEGLEMCVLDVPADAAVQQWPAEDAAGGDVAGRVLVARWTDGDGNAEERLVLLRASAGSYAASLKAEDGHVVATIPGSTEPLHVEVVVARAAASSELAAQLVADRAAAPFEPLAALTTGGPRRYPETLTTRGERGADSGAFAVDTITVPSSNPWKSRLRFGAFDFVDEDTAALSTWNGDVWLVDGIDDDLDELTWTRFCTGLHDPLGLKVVDGVIYTHGRDGLHRLHDLNDDGWCDFVEVFNNDVLMTKGFHEFAFDLQTDAEGNFYFSKGGPVNPGGRGFQKIVPHHGTVMRVSKDGSKLDVMMTGLRAPNGIGIGPNGEITTGDNQGTWMPACRLNISTNGQFGGCVDTAHMAYSPARYDEPICWLPMAIDNSGGGQVWVPEGHWGPFGGELLHQSYGQCNVYAVLRQQDFAGRTQGGVVRLPASFASSQMRGRFHGDGNLYTVGFKGWQTRAALDTAFQRVRRTDAPLRLPVGLGCYTEGIELTFSDPLDPEIAKDPESYSVQVWDYDWSQAYGSPEVKPSDPTRKVKGGEKNRDDLKVLDAELSPDGKTVFLRVAGMQTCMQMRIGWNLDGADGELVEGEIHNTIHFLPTRAVGTR